jgi:hypothetical protein
MHYIIHPDHLSSAFQRPHRERRAGSLARRRFHVRGDAGQPVVSRAAPPAMLGGAAGDPVADYRNVLVALWAGRRLGLGRLDTQRYARDLMIADRQEPGFGDVARKVAADLRRAGLLACAREARRQVMAAQNVAMRGLLSPA